MFNGASVHGAGGCKSGCSATHWILGTAERYGGHLAGYCSAKNPAPLLLFRCRKVCIVLCRLRVRCEAKRVRQRIRALDWTNDSVDRCSADAARAALPPLPSAVIAS